MIALSTTKLPASAGSNQIRHLVTDSSGHRVGLLTTYKKTRTERFPWLVQVGVGYNSRVVGHFWGTKAGAVRVLRALLQEGEERCLRAFKMNRLDGQGGAYIAAEFGVSIAETVTMIAAGEIVNQRNA